MEFIVPSNDVEPDMEKFFDKLQSAFDGINIKLHGIKHGKDEDYTTGMAVMLTPKPAPSPPQPRTPQEQEKRLQKEVRVD